MKPPIPFAVPAPEHLSPAERAIWQSINPRDFSPFELVLLELFAVHTVKHRELMKNEQSSDIVRIVRQEAAFVKALADALGPAWRAQSKARPPADVDDGWGEFDRPIPPPSTEIH